MYKLRELCKEDLKEINKWRNNKTLIDNLGAQYRYINLSVDEKWYDNYMQNRMSCVRCSIIDENNNIIGLVSLTDINQINQSCIYHIMIGNDVNQGKGAGTYATKTMINHAFNNLNLKRIELSVLTTNKQAIHLYESCGFIKEGTRRKCTYKNGKFVDMHIYSILYEDWISRI